MYLLSQKLNHKFKKIEFIVLKLIETFELWEKLKLKKEDDEYKIK